MRDLTCLFLSLVSLAGHYAPSPVRIEQIRRESREKADAFQITPEEFIRFRNQIRFLGRILTPPEQTFTEAVNSLGNSFLSWKEEGRQWAQGPDSRTRSREEKYLPGAIVPLTEAGVRLTKQWDASGMQD